MLSFVVFQPVIAVVVIISEHCLLCHFASFSNLVSIQLPNRRPLINREPLHLPAATSMQVPIIQNSHQERLFGHGRKVIGDLAFA